MKCINCGAEIEDNSKYCKECGNPNEPTIEQVIDFEKEDIKVDAPHTKHKKERFIITLIIICFAALFFLFIYPLILRNQIKGTWYQTVYETDSSYTLKLEIKDEYIDYGLCIDDSLAVFGDTLPIGSPMRYKVQWLGISTIYLGESSLSGHTCYVFVWGDTLTIAPSFGGDIVGNRWGRFKGDELFFTQAWEDSIKVKHNYLTESSTPPISSHVLGSSTESSQVSSDPASSEKIDLKTANLLNLTPEQFVERFNRIRPENVEKMVLVYISTEHDYYHYALTESVNVGILTKEDKIKRISVEFDSAPPREYLETLVKSSDPLLSVEDMAYVVETLSRGGLESARSILYACDIEKAKYDWAQDRWSIGIQKDPISY